MAAEQNDSDRQKGYRLLELFAGRLVQDLTPSQILPQFTIGLSRADLQHIENVEKHESHEKAAELLLDKIINSEEKGVFAEFVNVLDRSEGSKHLAKLLRGEEDVDDLQPQKQLLRVLAPNLINDMNADTLRTRIQCLTDEDKDVIRNDYERNGGPKKAADTLLSRLVKRGPTWFTELLHALKIDSPHLYHQIIGVESDGNEIDQSEIDVAEKELRAGFVVTDNSASGSSQRASVTSNDNSCIENTIDNADSDHGLNSIPPSNDLSTSKDDAECKLVVDLSESKDQAKSTDSENISDDDEGNVNTVVNGSHVNGSDDDVTNTGGETQQTSESESEADAKVSDEEKAVAGVEPVISLRDYQAELAEPALAGKNTVVCAPTGSGKTRIAAYVTNEHLKTHPDGKVLLLVNKVPLVEQHFKKEFSLLQSKYKVSRLCGETASKVSFKQLVESNSVVILTAQILENALKGGEDREDKVYLTDFSLLIFDECHHTQKGEVYNNIMSQYLTLKIEKQMTGLPQILGLTASLGVGGAKDKVKAVRHILQLCANMDTSVLKTVKTQEKGLEKHNNEPKKCVEVVADREVDPLGDELKKLMKEIQHKLPAEYHNRSDFGTQMYEQHITSLNSTAVKRESRLMMTVSDHLRKYNDALLINDSVRMVDAIKYLEEFYESEDERKQGFDELDEELMELFYGRFGKLTKLSKKKENENPKLVKLKGQILEEYTDKENARGIIFTRTRQSTKALMSWINETPELKTYLKVDRLTGTGATSGSRSVAMTQKEQQDVIRKFRMGELNCLIATTVAEEGLDIPECNVVIRYNLVTNEIAMVQARGRARAEDSSYTLLAGKNSGAAERELSNMYKEKLEKGAVDLVQKMQKEDFKKEVDKLQVEALNYRKIQEANLRAKRRVTQSTTAHLICRKCNIVACNADKIRKIEDMHHVVPDEEFQEMFNVREYTPMEYGDILFVGKIICKKCERDWGSMILHKGALLPCLSIKNFGLKFHTGFILTPKKWKDVPIEIQALDFMAYIEKKLGIPLADVKQKE